MMARIRKSLDEKEKGFTLIELLVVIIIIGILSAIAIPLFLNQRKKAVDASIKSDLRTVATNLETTFTDGLKYWPVATAGTPPIATLTGSPTGTPTVTLSTGNTVTGIISTTNTEAYCLAGSAAAGKATQAWVYISNKGGLQPSATIVCPTAF